MSLVERWRTRFLEYELIAAAAIGIGAAGWSEFLGGKRSLQSVLDGNRGPLYSTLTTANVSLLGFVVTATSILWACSDRGRMKRISESSHWTTVLRVFASSSWWLGMGAIASIAALLVDRDAAPIFALFYCVVFACAAATFRMWRCLWILQNVIDIARPIRRETGD